jgi:hypothetical protein
MNVYAPGARIAGRYEVAGRPLLLECNCLRSRYERWARYAVAMGRGECYPDLDERRERTVRAGASGRAGAAHGILGFCLPVS